MQKFFLIAAIITFFSIGLGFISPISPVSPVNATVPCPTPGTCGGCSFQGCGDNCHCRNGCGGYLCPWCDPDDCSDIYGDGWNEGRCNGSPGCHERSFKCNCDNGTHYCRRWGNGDEPTPTPAGPTDTPAPTNTPVPTSTPTPTQIPTPTPIQPTEIIAFPLPSPGEFSEKAEPNVQNWVCLQTTPCSTGGLICSGGNSQHRVRITTKTDAKLIPNRELYIFECLGTPDGYRCTTGDGLLDQNLTGNNYLSSLYGTYGYQFIALTDIQNNPIQQSFTDQPIITDGTGTFGPLEWESFTSTQIGRVMMAMQNVKSDQDVFQIKSQQLGTFLFDSSYETICIMIKWDPYGTVFDIDNLKPIEGAKVTLLHKNKDNNFEPVKAADIFNGLKNPQITTGDGKYAFYVPDGIYKIKLEKEGYQPVFEVKSVDKGIWKAYPQLYDGGEIVTKGKLELRNLAMKKMTISDQIRQTFQDIWLDIINAR